MRPILLVMLTVMMTDQTRAQALTDKQESTAIRVDVDLVNILCNVYDKHGALVNDLNRDDFEVRENGKLQQLRYFSRETDLPLTVALLVDVSGSVRRFVEIEKDAAGHFLKDVLRRDDQALLLGFSSTLILWQDFTSSPAALQAALTRLHAIRFRGLPADGQPMPSTLLYDAIYGTAHQKLKGVQGRKVVVVISDGLDNGSQTNLGEAVAAAESTNTIVYGICYHEGFSGYTFLNDLAQPTGGRAFNVDRKTPLSTIFQTIEAEMRSQYALGYVPMNRAHDGSFRRLQIRVRKPGLRVHTRKGYFALAA
jgi:VWFA-related protein